MKKILSLFIFIALSLFLASCTSHDVKNPYEINVDGKILSYYDTKDDISIKGFHVTDNLSDTFGSAEKPNFIYVNEEGKIRAISITDNSAVTYKNISVGDSIDKVIESFEHEDSVDNRMYSTIFNDGIEEDPMSQNKEDDWLNIHYATDGNIITHILISDVSWGTKLE